MRQPITLPSWTAAPALALALLLSACGGGGGDAPPAETPQATVAGTVLDAGTGAPVVGATVATGDQTATTDANGKFSRLTAANAQAAVKVSKVNYAENVVIANAVNQQTTTITAQLLPVAVATPIDAVAGGTVTVPGSVAQVVLPPASLVRADGLPISGAVTVSVTPIDPALNPAYMPGDFRARTATGSTVSRIESYGAMTVTLADATGSTVNLAAGKSATIRIPLATRGVPTPTIPLFWFDTSTGVWIEEGTAALAGTAPDQYYEGTVTHFTTWNADQYYNTVLVSGCVKDAAGALVVGAQVYSDGIDYSGTASALTDANGNFSVAMKRNGEGTLTGQSGTRFSNTLSVGPSDVDFAALPAGECLILGSVSEGLTIKLSWGSAPSDVDSYLLTPDGEVVYFGSKGNLAAAPYAALDVDDTSSFGPEVVTVRRLMVGTYRYAVNNYSGTSAPGLTDSPVRVELNRNGEVSVFAPSAGEAPGTVWWSVFSFTVDAQCRITVTPVNSWSASEPALPPAATPVYCTAP